MMQIMKILVQYMLCAGTIMTLANSLNEASDGASLLREDTALREMAQSLPGLTTLTGNSIILCINQLFRSFVCLVFFYSLSHEHRCSKVNQSIHERCLHNISRIFLCLIVHS